MADEEVEMMERPPLDYFSKPEGSLNVTVQKNIDRIKKQKEKLKAETCNKHLNTIEKDAEKLIAQETVINVDKMLLENMRRVYVKSKIRGEEHLDDVIKQEFFDNLCQDEYVDSKIDLDVRETVDGDRETLDAFLYRVDKVHSCSRIHWE